MSQKIYKTKSDKKKFFSRLVEYLRPKLLLKACLPIGKYLQTRQNDEFNRKPMVDIVVCSLSFLVCYLLFVVCRLSFVVCRLSFVVCRLSLVVSRKSLVVSR